MTSEELISIATYFATTNGCSCDPENDVFNCMGCDVARMAEYVRGIVKKGDDDPVTPEWLVADGWEEINGAFYLKNPPDRFIGYRVTLTEQYPGYLWSSVGSVVRKLESMGRLRLILRALGD